MKLQIEKIRMDGGTQPRAEIDTDVVQEYADAMQAGAVFPPLVVFYDGSDYWLADGFHRIGAAYQAEKESVECEVKQGTLRDARLYSVGANSTHGLKRTNADKRRAVETLLNDDEWARWSDREIARRCNVSNQFVSNVRPKVSVNNGQIEAPRKAERNGTTYTIETIRINESRRELAIEQRPYCLDCQEYHAIGKHNREVVVQPKALPVIEAEPNSFITVQKWEAMNDKQRQAIINAPRNQSFKMNQTNDNVEWAMWTWNPITGCLHNCTYCYARDIASRFYKQGFEPTFLPERLDGPKNTKVPDRAKDEIGYGNVFTCSMADLFGKWVPQEWIDAVLDVMQEQRQWNYLVLTKFPQRLSEQLWPANTWVGASIDRQARVKETLRCFDRVKSKSNAGITWLSLEPLLEPLKFDSLAMFDMVVIGGASASTQTPEWMPPAGWIGEIMSQAAKDGVAVYLKTNGRPREYPTREIIKIAPKEFGLAINQY